MRTSAVRECEVHVRDLGMAACLVCDAVRSCAVLSAAGCVVCVDIETCAPHFARACVRCNVPHVQRLAACLMCGAVRPRATYRGGVCDQSLYWSLSAAFCSDVRTVRHSACAARVVHFCTCVRLSVRVRRSTRAARAVYPSS